MADVVHRSTLEFRKSVHTPDYDPAEWLINPILPDCERKYWKVVGDFLTEMDAAEKLAADAAELETAKTTKIGELRELAMQKAGEERQDYQRAAQEVADATSLAELEAITLDAKAQ